MHTYLRTSPLLRSLLLLSFASCIALTSSGCVTSGEGKKMWSEINTLKQNQQAINEDRERLSNSLKQSTDKLAELEGVIKQARDLLARNNADLGAEMIEVRKVVDRLRGELEVVRRSLDETRKEFNLFRNDVDQRLGAGAGSGTSAALPADADGLWSASNERFERGDYAGARNAFETFLASYPKDKRADNAQYFVGETFRKQGEHANAILAYRKVLQNHRRSDVEDAAVYRSAGAFVRLKQCDNAKALYESFISEYSRSKYRKNAKAELKAIQSNGCK